MKSLCIVLVLSLLMAQGATVVVTDCIAEALNRAQAGDTLLVVGPRILFEQVTITKSVRILATNSVVLDGNKTGTPLTILAANVEVRGFTIRNSGSDLANFDSAVMIRSNHTTIAECRIENDAFGIYIRGANDCRIERNEITGSNETLPSKRGNGIHLWKTRDNAIVGNRIQDKRDGMYFSYADGNLIASNSVRETRFGIHYMYSHSNRLLTNTLTANAVGATLMFSRDSVIAGNTVVANRRHGILLKQVDRSRISGNLVSEHNRGFFVQQATQNRFEANTIATNDIGLYLSNGSEQNVFVKNNFIGNTDQVWQPADEVDAGRLSSNNFFEGGHGNYWSDYTGSDRNQDGIGDTPYHETDVFGYIVERHPDARAFALSPAVSLLRKGEGLMPLLDVAGVTDLFPLIAPAATERSRTPAGSNPITLFTAVGPDNNR